MSKISKNSFQKNIETVKKVIMEKKDKLPQLNPETLKQLPDEAIIGSKNIKYHPETAVYEKVVQEDGSEAMNKLRELIVKKLD